MYGIKKFWSNPCHHLPLIMIGVTIIAPTLISLYLYITIFGTDISHQHEAWAQFGDFFGGFLGGLSILAIIYTLIIQQKQLKYQQQEIKEQQKQQKLDAYERMVFWLIDSHQKILDELYVPKYTYESLEERRSALLNKFEPSYDDNAETTGKETLSLIDLFYAQFNEQDQTLQSAHQAFEVPQYHLINTYCRHLFNALRIINNRYPIDNINAQKRENSKEMIEHSPTVVTEIKEYIHLLSAFIPDKLLFILAVYITHPDSSDEPYKKLVKHYNLLEHLSFSCYLKKLELFSLNRDIASSTDLPKQVINKSKDAAKESEQALYKDLTPLLIKALGDEYLSTNKNYKKINAKLDEIRL